VVADSGFAMLIDCFELDARRLPAGPSTSVFMPRGIPHTFRIQSPAAILLGAIAPGRSSSFSAT